VTGAAPWTVSHPDEQRVSELSEALGMGSIAAKCLVNRNLADPEEAKAFLAPNLADLKVPDEMADLALGAGRLADAVIGKERVAVFGDYDVDGMSGAALLTTFFQRLGVTTVTRIADRFAGYGMTSDAIEHFSKGGCSVIVAVDCGTSDHEAAARAAKAGIDLVIIDHHRIDGDFPNAYAFVNPERKDCGFGDRTLAAVGLAFYFAAAVRTALVNRGHVKRSDLDLRFLLDLVALGTVADVMPLVGNNRILVRHGLAQMSRKPREGLKSLIRLSRIRSSAIRTDHIAFQLAPRLNAAGRLGEATEAFDLLVAEDRREAYRLAEKLDKFSQQRRLLEADIIEAAKQEAGKQGMLDDKVLVVSGDGWHRGVLGIVAARLVEWAGKPAYVIGFDADGGTGSARGKGQVNLHGSLIDAADCLRRYGGHRDAAGFSVSKDAVAAFKQRVIAYAEANWFDVDQDKMVCDASIDASEISPDLLAELGRLGPFGSGNPEPVLEINGLYVLDSRVVGGEHLKLELKTPSRTIGAFGPRMGAMVNDIPPLARVAAHITYDEWRGDGSPELRLLVPPVPGS
jgi:single-stranded-DNA-specific exonuclease